ncbi:protein phosphatase 1 regulatory subunit 42, partial [Argonema antarcticum]|uniref:protein phosphatase 1 regulatory subunit 42 n=1 Tax=Argonema antarcticum TaxID=2942763 RepID=UPI0020113448
MSELQPNQAPIFSSFADWCLHKDSLSKEARHTVEVLLKCAGTSDCNKLTNLTYLELYNNQITDLSGLSTLTNLTYLNLYSNQITDLSGLSTLTNLTSLILYNNQITDLSGLSTLTNLTSLHLDNNQITDR